MKKSAALLSFALITLTSAVALACPTACSSSFVSADCFAFTAVFTSILWVPIALLTVLALFFLRKRFARRRGLVMSMLGAFPFSGLALIGVLEFIVPVLEHAFHKDSLEMASAAGCLMALNAGYVAACYLLGRE